MNCSPVAAKISARGTIRSAAASMPRVRGSR